MLRAMVYSLWKNSKQQSHRYICYFESLGRSNLPGEVRLNKGDEILTVLIPLLSKVNRICIIPPSSTILKDLAPCLSRKEVVWNIASPHRDPLRSICYPRMRFHSFRILAWFTSSSCTEKIGPAQLYLITFQSH